MTKEQFLATIAKTERLVPAPRTLSHAMRLLRSSDSDLSDISDLISRDTALVVDVLRCANSAYYGVGWQVTSIGEAVQIIGFRETIRLLNLVAAHQTASRDLGS
jgi:HD-like signal output (HDOD) protein